jgi:UDP-glucose 4-epimerase
VANKHQNGDNDRTTKRKLSLNVLVIGGAGYIGSVTAQCLVDAGHRISVLDNLSRGHKQAIPQNVPFYCGDYGDSLFLEDIFSERRFDAVMHFGAISLVGESVVNPALYFENNVAKGVSLLSAMVKYKVRNFVFSSSAAVYGEPEQQPITESARLEPTSPYGETKLAFEKALKWYSKAYDLNYCSLRYFNAAGAMGDLGEDHASETHLIPLVLQVALGKRESISIYGNDYTTADGTCIRDYIHVKDLANAHIISLEQMMNDNIKNEIFNLGTNSGFSVLQVIESARRVTGHAIPVQFSPRRAGDPAVLIASNEKCKQMLKFEPLLGDIDKIIADAWAWHQKFPDGFSPN